MKIRPVLIMDHVFVLLQILSWRLAIRKQKSVAKIMSIIQKIPQIINPGLHLPLADGRKHSGGIIAPTIITSASPSIHDAYGLSQTENVPICTTLVENVSTLYHFSRKRLLCFFDLRPTLTTLSTLSTYAIYSITIIFTSSFAYRPQEKPFIQQHHRQHLHPTSFFSWTKNFILLTTH